ncbi:MAG: hypothetical protein KIT22_07900 [Verrucomicrobiae bacterium]|nr:hypothetical protein [Verrucomicrobiae bacterium]
MRILWLCISLATAVAALAQQNVPRAFPTVADMLAVPPERLATTTVGTSTNFLAWVQTTGDFAPGTGARSWIWNRTSSAATNALTSTNLATIARPYGAATGRWVQVPDAVGGSYAPLTPNRVLTTDGLGFPISSDLPSSSLSLLSGGTSPFQTQVDNLYLKSVRSLNSMADAASLAALGSSAVSEVVMLRGYHASAPGVGSGFWYRDLASSYKTNRAVIPIAGGGRLLPIFDNGLIDVTKFGMRSGITDDIAKCDANLMQQDFQGWPGARILLFPIGIWQFTTPITNNYNRKYPNIFQVRGMSDNLQIGSNSDTGYEEDRFLAASVLRMMSDNTPILKFSGQNSSVTDLAFDYANRQYWELGHTNSNCIEIPANSADAGKMTLRNLFAYNRVFRLIYCPSPGEMWNCVFDNLNVRGAAGGAMWIQRAGTVSAGTMWYLQGYYPPYGTNANSACDVNTAVPPVLSGTNLTFRIVANAKGWIQNLNIGTKVTVDGYPWPAHDGISVGKETARFVSDFNFVGYGSSSNTITVAVSAQEASAWAGTPPAYTGDVDISANISYRPWGPYVKLNGQWAINGLNIEHLTGYDPDSGAPAGGIALDTSGIINIQQLHLEGIQPGTNGSQVIIRNLQGTLDIDTPSVVNMSLPPGRAIWLVENRAQSGQTYYGNSITNTGYVRMGQLVLRDIWANGNFTISRSPQNTSLTNIIEHYYPQQNRRVGGRSDWPMGVAVKADGTAW